MLNGVLIALQVRCETALVADSGGVALALQQLLKAVEYLGTPAKGLTEGRRTHGHDHELLSIHRIRCMRAAVQDVHHRHRQAVGIGTAQETIQGNAQRLCSSLAAGNGHCQNGIGAQLCLVLCTVSRQHSGIYRINILGIHSLQGIVDDGIDILYGLGNALAAELCLVIVSELDGLELTGGCTAGRCTSSHSTIRQIYLCLYRRISSGINDFPTDYLFNAQMLLHRLILLYLLLLLVYIN